MRAGAGMHSVVYADALLMLWGQLLLLLLMVLWELLMLPVLWHSRRLVRVGHVPGGCSVDARHESRGSSKAALALLLHDLRCQAVLQGYIL